MNTIWFALPGVREAPATLVEQAGPGVLQLILSNKSAIVTVAATWVNGHDRKARLRGICETLEAKGIQRAAIFVDGKGMIGQLEIDGCRPVGLPLPKPPPPELGGQQPR